MKKIPAKVGVVFIPGIMGTSLKCLMRGECGDEYYVDVWGEEVEIYTHILYRQGAGILLNDTVIPNKIIRNITRNGKVKKNLYGPMLDYFVDKDGIALIENYDFFPFPYDWRLDNKKTAEILYNFICSLRDNGIEKIILIAHSMGGIIAKLMHALYSDIRNMIASCLLIACPMGGSAKAFYTLRKRPDAMHPGITFCLNMIYRINPEWFLELMSVLRDFDSIYQLLPYDKPILHDDNGIEYFAMDRKIWYSYLSGKIDSAIAVVNILSKEIPFGCHCSYVDCKQTDSRYYIDSVNGYKIKGIYQEDGDGLVESTSAVKFSEAPVCFSDDYLDHGSICNEGKLLAIIKERIDELKLQHQ